MRKIFVSLLLFSIVLVVPFFLCQAIGESDVCSLLTEDPYSYAASGGIHLGLFSIAMFFLWKKDLRNTLKELSFPGNIKKNILFTVAGLATIFFALLVFGMVASALGFNDQEKITEKVSTLPLYVLAFAIIFAPLSEELFFRALLVPRIGIVFSSLFFGLMHFSYGSVIEVAGTIIVGFILAAIFRISKSITPCIFIHVIYNLVSITVMRFLT